MVFSKKFNRTSHKKTGVSEKRIVAIAKKVAFGQIEQRYYDYACSAGFATISTSWCEALLSAIPQGTGLATRTGDKIELNGLYYDALIENSYGAVWTADDFNVLRVVIGLYEYGTGTPLATTGLTMTQPIRKDTCNILQRKLYDEYIPLIPNGISWNGASVINGVQVKHLKLNFVFKKPIVIRYTGSASTSGCTGLFLSIIGDSSVTPHPGIVNGYYSLRYKDC